MEKYQITRDDFCLPFKGLDVFAKINYTFNRESFPGDHWEQPSHDDTGHHVEIIEVQAFDAETGEEVELTLSDDLRKAIAEKVIAELTEEAEEV